MAKNKGFVELELFDGGKFLVSVNIIKRVYEISRRKSTIYLEPNVYHEVKNDFDNIRRQIKQARR